jgi:hypothetical protein
VEIEILKGERKGENKKEHSKEESVYCIKELARELAGVQETGYRLLAENDLSEAEKDKVIDIIATAKGGMHLTDKLLADKSDVADATHKKIDKKADAFLAGLDASEEDTTEEE